MLILRNASQGRLTALNKKNNANSTLQPKESLTRANSTTRQSSVANDDSAKYRTMTTVAWSAMPLTGAMKVLVSEGKPKVGGVGKRPGNGEPRYPVSVKVAPELAGPLLGDKTWSVVFDNTKIKEFVPGFQAVIPFREGIRRTVAWFEADKSRQRVDPAINAQLDRILAACGGKAF